MPAKSSIVINEFQCYTQKVKYDTAAIFGQPVGFVHSKDTKKNPNLG